MQYRAQCSTSFAPDDCPSNLFDSRATTPTTQASRATTPGTQDSSRCSSASMTQCSSAPSLTFSSDWDWLLTDADEMREQPEQKRSSRSQKRKGSVSSTSSIASLAKDPASFLSGLQDARLAWPEISTRSSLISDSLRGLAGMPSRALPRRSRSTARCSDSIATLPPSQCGRKSLPPLRNDGSREDDSKLSVAFHAFSGGRHTMHWTDFDRLAKTCIFFDSTLSAADGHRLFTRLLQNGQRGLDFNHFKTLLQHIAYERGLPFPSVQHDVVHSAELGMQHRQHNLVRRPSHVRRSGTIASRVTQSQMHAFHFGEGAV